MLSRWFLNLKIETTTWTRILGFKELNFHIYSWLPAIIQWASTNAEWWVNFLCNLKACWRMAGVCVDESQYWIVESLNISVLDPFLPASYWYWNWYWYCYFKIFIPTWYGHWIFLNFHIISMALVLGLKADFFAHMQVFSFLPILWFQSLVKFSNF